MYSLSKIILSAQYISTIPFYWYFDFNKINIAVYSAKIRYVREPFIPELLTKFPIPQKDQESNEHLTDLMNNSINHFVFDVDSSSQLFLKNQHSLENLILLGHQTLPGERKMLFLDGIDTFINLYY